MMKIWQNLKNKASSLLNGRKLAGAAKELALHADKFEGLYEPAKLFAQDQSLPSPLNEWNVRAKAISPEGELARYLDELCQKGNGNRAPLRRVRRLLRVIRKAGIYREEADEGKLIVSGAQVRAYIALDGHNLAEGEQINILKAAWYLNGRVVEHGLAGVLP